MITVFIVFINIRLEQRMFYSIELFNTYYNIIINLEQCNVTIKMVLGM